MPDQVYMPFVENGDFIQLLLEELYRNGIYHEAIIKILELNRAYRKVTEQIIKEHKKSPGG